MSRACLREESYFKNATAVKGTTAAIGHTLLNRSQQSDLLAGDQMSLSLICCPAVGNALFEHGDRMRIDKIWAMPSTCRPQWAEHIRDCLLNGSRSSFRNQAGKKSL